MIDISSLIQRTIDVSTQLSKMTSSYDAELPQRVEEQRKQQQETVARLGPGKKAGRATSTQSVGAEFYFKDVLFTQETPEFIL